MVLKLKRAYDPPSPTDGVRILVDRLWPRGVSKIRLNLTRGWWAKQVAPSTELRQWFAHDPAKWTEFQRRYFVELRRNREAWLPILQASKRGTVTLIYAARDTLHNNAVALKTFLQKQTL